MPKTDEEVQAAKDHYDALTANMTPEGIIASIEAITQCSKYLARAAIIIAERGWGQKAWSRNVLGRVHEAGRVTSKQRRFSVPGALVAAIYENEEPDPDGALTLCCDLLVHSLLQASIRQEGVNELLGTPEQRWARATEITQQPSGGLNAIGRWNDESCQNSGEAVTLLNAGVNRANTWIGSLRARAN